RKPLVGDERTLDRIPHVRVENPEVRITPVARTGQRELRHDRTGGRAVPGRETRNVAVRNVEEAGSPLGHGTAVDAAVDARTRNGRNRHAETLHLASAVSSAVRHETRLESFLG